jgi:hypothetical protein
MFEVICMQQNIPHIFHLYSQCNRFLAGTKEDQTAVHSVVKVTPDIWTYNSVERYASKFTE